jgi:hypothetical protein
MDAIQLLAIDKAAEVGVDTKMKFGWLPLLIGVAMVMIVLRRLRSASHVIHSRTKPKTLIDRDFNA